MADNHSLNVMVVDDELPLRQELRLFPWIEHGFELMGEAENGQEALSLCRRLKPDIVITDITMPVMDGLAFFRILKEELPVTQVILLTCHSDFEYAREALRLGAVEYLLKVTMDPSELLNALMYAKEAYLREKSFVQTKLQSGMKADSSRLEDDAESTEGWMLARRNRGQMVDFIRKELPEWAAGYDISGSKASIRKEVEDAIHYIKENLHRPLTLSVVAEHVRLSPHYFSRLFKEETGISFQSYITSKRMERAAYLLRTSSLRVYEVAYDVGIPSYRYFAAMFRDYAGISPTEYKKSGLSLSPVRKE